MKTHRVWHNIHVLIAVLLIQAADAQIPSVAFKFSYEIEEELATGALRPSTAAYEYTYIGDYLHAMSTYGLEVRWGLDTLLIQQDLNRIHPVPAARFIAEQASIHQVTVINEAHNKAHHRVFGIDLLQDLYDVGYRYLGLECLADPKKIPPEFRKDSLTHWGYPILSYAIGTYSREPQMGNLIREALTIGYEIFPYEKMMENEERDLVQAKNIANFLKSHSAGKTLIFCGWDHAIEADIVKRRDARFMAHHLRNMLNQDILTNDQDILSENLSGEETEIYRKLNASQPSIFVDERGKEVSFFKDFSHFDLLVYHPPSVFEQGRPSWLMTPGKRKFFINMEEIKSFPAIVSAIPDDNDNRATPVDIVEIKYRYHKAPLLLHAGNYVVQIRYDTGQEDRIRIKVE